MVDGKTDKRKLMAQPEILDIRNELFNLHPTKEPDDLIWINLKKQHIYSFKETFRGILKELNLHILQSVKSKNSPRSLT
jgi:hypothetical protein